MSSPSQPSPRVRPVSQLTPRTLTWLWQRRLALGKLAMLDGDPGLGKSLVALDLAARLSTGRPLPDGSPGPPPCPVIILNGEDGDQDTTRPRLQTLGADLDRIFMFDQDENSLGEPVHFPEHTPVLDQELARTGAKLVVIDPIMAFLSPAIHAHSDKSVRRALHPLLRLAAKHHCVILLIRHLNKKGGWRSLYRGSGSIAFLGACRSGWLIGLDPHNSRRCVLAQVKNNLAPPQPSLAYTVQLRDDAPPVLDWAGPSPWRADQLLGAAAGVFPFGSPGARARDFLRGFLEDGPRTARAIWEAAQEQGLAERTLQRARQDIDARTLRVHLEGKQLTYWLLPGQELPADVPAAAREPDLEEWLAPLRKQFPPLTPLDEV